MTIKELLNKGISVLKNKKTASLDAAVLLANVLGMDGAEIIVNYDQPVIPDLEKLYEKYLERAKTGEPIAYITKEKEFYALNFYVDSRVLIPRPETEKIVDETLQFLAKNYKENTKYRLLDVGTGSGNIAIAVAKSFHDSEGMRDTLEFIDAIDISEDAIEVAKMNVAQHCMEDLICPFQSDLLENIEDGEKYEVIMANLPYIGEAKNDYVEADVKAFEPAHALFAGQDGLSLYEKLFEQILSKGIQFKMLIGEFGDGQRKDLEELLEKYFPGQYEIEKDLANLDRFFIVKNSNVR